MLLELEKPNGGTAMSTIVEKFLKNHFNHFNFFFSQLALEMFIFGLHVANKDMKCTVEYRFKYRRIK